jgi:hypothetical protein
MPLTGIQLLFETLVHCTRAFRKCENLQKGSKICNLIVRFCGNLPRIRESGGWALCRCWTGALRPD